MATHSVNSGPWSLEWLQDRVHGDAGVVSTSKQNSKHKQSTQASLSKVEADGTLKNRLKTSCKLKHSSHNLKKIARLPDSDRKQVLIILMKKVQRCRGVKKAEILS